MKKNPFRNYEVKFELYWDAGRTASVIVEAKSERKAIKMATEKAKKLYHTPLVKFISLKEAV